MSKCIDLTGQRFGKLVVLKQIESNKFGQTMWSTCCDCGNIKDVSSNNLRTKRVVSCGCRRRVANLRHGMYRTRLYRTWINMKQRCTPNHQSQHHYYLRGIHVCDKWKSFEGFLEDMEGGFSNGMTLDRIDGTRGYEKSNCRWITQKQQTRNRSDTLWVDMPEGRMCLSEVAEKYGLEYDSIFRKFKRGIPVTDLIKYARKRRGVIIEVC